MYFRCKLLISTPFLELIYYFVARNLPVSVLLEAIWHRVESIVEDLWRTWLDLTAFKQRGQLIVKLTRQIMVFLARLDVCE